MVAFVLFLIFISVNENNAITPNEKEMKQDTLPLNIKPEVLTTSPKKLRIRRYQDEYIDPFLPEAYYEIPQHIDNRLLLENSQPRYHYNDFHKTDSGRLNSEDISFQNTASPGDASFITQRDPEIYSRRKEYIDYGIQRNPYGEIKNAKLWDDMDANEYYLADSKDIGYHFQESPEKLKGIPVIYNKNETPRRSNENNVVPYAKIHNSANTLENNQHNTFISHVPSRSKLADEDYPYVTQYHSFYDPMIPIKKEPEAVLKNVEFSDKISLDKDRIQQENNIPLHLKAPRELDELEDFMHLKHSLTSSDSAMEKRLSTAHIKRSFETVKDDAVDGFLKVSKSPFYKYQANEYSNIGNGVKFENRFKKPEQNRMELQTNMFPYSSSTINNNQQYKTKHCEGPFENMPSISPSDRILSKSNEIQHPVLTSRENGYSFRKPEVIYSTNLPKPNISRNQIVPSQNNMEKYMNDFKNNDLKNIQSLGEINPFESRKAQHTDIKYIKKLPSDNIDNIIEFTPQIIKSSLNNIQPVAEILNVKQLSKDNPSRKVYSPLTQTALDISLIQNTKEEREILHSPAINGIQNIQTANYQQNSNIKTATAAPTYAAQVSSYYEINKPKVTILNPPVETQHTIKVHQLPSSYYMPGSTNPQSGSIIVPKAEVLSHNNSILSPQPWKATPITYPGYQASSSIKYTPHLSNSLNKLASVIATDILAGLNRNISKALNQTKESKWPTFEDTHPCIESPRCLPETQMKQQSKNTQNSSSKSSKVSTITINVLPPVQQPSNDIIILI